MLPLVFSVRRNTLEDFLNYCRTSSYNDTGKILIQVFTGGCFYILEKIDPYGCVNKDSFHYKKASSSKVIFPF